MFARGVEDSGRREEAGEMTGRTINYQRLDKGLINIKGQLGLKRVGGHESKTMPKKDLIPSIKCNDDSKKEHSTRKTRREKTRGERWERMNDEDDWDENLLPLCLTSMHTGSYERQTACIFCRVWQTYCTVYLALSDAPEKHHRWVQIESKGSVLPESYTSFPALTKATSVT